MDLLQKAMQYITHLIMTINIFLIFFSAGTVKKDSHQSKFYCSSENEYNFKPEVRIQK